MSNTITLKKVTIADLATLLSLSRRVFFAAFAHHNHPEDMEAYAAKAFTQEKLISEIGHPDSEFYFAVIEKDIVGYLKINLSGAQTEFQDDEALEIERLYIDPQFQNQRIGQQLMDFAISIAHNKSLKYVWLGVWDGNINGIRFYERNGFHIFGSHQFMLGSDLQTDLLMKKEL